MVPFLNLKGLFESHREEFLSAIANCLDKTAYIGGPEVTAFETAFSNWIGPGNHTVGVGNGTDAITIAAKALDLPPGSEALVPAMTFVATLEGLIHAGLVPRLVDVSPGTWLIDPKQVEQALTPKTRLIVPVHLYGQMAPMDDLKKIAGDHNCQILEDAAQAHGAKWKGRPVGEWSDVSTFSFYPGKNLGAFGDAGAILSRRAEVVEKCRALGNHGGIVKYSHDLVGFNSRLDAIQATILKNQTAISVRLERSPKKNCFDLSKGLAPLSEIGLPVEHPDAYGVYHLFVITVKERKSFQTFLKETGIETGVHYPKAIHQLKAFSEFSDQSFPNAEYVAAHGVSLPMDPQMGAEQALRVVSAHTKIF